MCKTGRTFNQRGDGLLLNLRRLLPAHVHSSIAELIAHAERFERFSCCLGVSVRELWRWHGSVLALQQGCEATLGSGPLTTVQRSSVDGRDGFYLREASNGV